MKPRNTPDSDQPASKPATGQPADRPASRDWLESELRTLSTQPRHRAPETFTARVMDRLDADPPLRTVPAPTRSERPTRDRLTAPPIRLMSDKRTDPFAGRLALWTWPAPSPAMAAAVWLPLMLLLALNVSILGNALRIPSASDSPLSGQTDYSGGIWEDADTDPESSVWVSVPFPDLFTEFAETADPTRTPSGSENP